MKQQGERRQIFLRYLGEVATAVSEINARRPRARSTSSCSSVAKKRTADADMKLDDRGQPIEEPRKLELRRERADRRSDSTAPRRSTAHRPRRKQKPRAAEVEVEIRT